MSQIGTVGSGGGGGAVIQLSGNVGVAMPVAGNINVVTANSTPIFVGSGDTLTLDFARTTNLALGSSLPALSSGTGNTSLGVGALAQLFSGDGNVSLGLNSLAQLFSGSSNIAIGLNSATNIVGGSNNIAIGDNANIGNHSGSIAIGSGSNATAAGSIVIGQTATDNGSTNIVIGGGSSLTGGDNIVIGNVGLPGADNISIGTSQTTCNIAGIYNTTPGAGYQIVVADNTNKLSTVVGGTFLQSISGNTGTADPDVTGDIAIVTENSTITFVAAGSTVTMDFSVDNTGSTGNLGLGTNMVGVTGANNTALGNTTFVSASTANDNTAIGAFCMYQNIVSGNNNTSVGTGSMFQVSSGFNNTAIGGGTLTVTSGSGNCAFGNQAGNGYSSTETNNICIGDGVVGTPLENNVIRIGNNSVTSTFVSGIYNTTPATGYQIVVADGSNKLSTIPAFTPTLAYTLVNTTPYVVLNTDDFLGVDSSGGPITIQLPNTTTVGRSWIVKDLGGVADIDNITVTTVGGAVLIDGFTTFIMNSSYQSASLLFNGTSYMVF